MNSVRTKVAEYTARLARAQVFAPEKDAFALVAHVLGIAPERLGGALDAILDAERLEKAESLVQRREKREPLARILGGVRFYDLDIRIENGVFRPCAETEGMVEHAILLFEERQEPFRILDLGTGSGCILLTLLKALPQATGLGIDVNEHIGDVGRANAKLNGVEDRVEFRVGDWGAGLEEKFDLIVCNPPVALTDVIPRLAPEMKDYETMTALDGGADGMNFYRYMADDFARLAKPGGLGVFQSYFYGQEAKLFDEAGFLVTTKVNYCGRPCCVVVWNERRVLKFSEKLKDRARKLFTFMPQK